MPELLTIIMIVGLGVVVAVSIKFWSLSSDERKRRAEQWHDEPL